MAGVSFILNDDAFQAALGRLQSAVTNPRGAMDAIGAHFVFSTKRNFEKETAPDGTKWRALSPRTAEKRIRKGRRGYDHILVVKNRLYDSISHAPSEQSVEWGTNVPYGRVHQLGGVIDMPARSGTVTLKNIRKKGNRFARPGRVGGVERQVSIRAHQVPIPARPYLGISAADREMVPLIITDHLAREVGNQ